MRRKLVENLADLKKLLSQPVIDDLSNSEVRDLVGEDKDPAVDVGDAGG